MRLVQITVPRGKRETLLGALEDEELEYAVVDETGSKEYAAVAYVPLPTPAVEPVLETLRSAGLDEESFTVVVTADSISSRRYDRLEAEYAEDRNEDRIAREELLATASELAPERRTYVLLTAVSALIATAGLLLDSAAVVVGSMVIAPLIGPAMAASVGTVLNDADLQTDGVRLQLLGLAVSVLVAFGFAALARYGNLVPPLADVTAVPEIRERVLPDFLSLVIALGAGVAGVASLTTGAAAAIVGVMIAVALIPPAATVGIGLAWAQPPVVAGAGVLLVVNVLSINLAALLGLWYAGYRPDHWFESDSARRATIRRIAVLAAGIVLLSVALGGVTLDSYQRVTTDAAVDDTAAAVLEQQESALELVDVSVEYAGPVPFQDPEEVTVTVGIEPGEPPPELASLLRERIAERTGVDVTTRVRYVQTETG